MVDDDADVRQVLARVLRGPEFGVEAFESAELAWPFLEQNGEEVDVVLTDVHLPGLDGIGLLARVRERWPTLPVVVMTGRATIESAVLAMREGAYDYLAKPFPRLDVVALEVKRAADHRRLERRSELLASQLQRATGIAGLIGNAPRMRAVVQLVDAVAPTDATVLLLGESGTGKELVARAIHARGPRKARPFIPLNCSALPETLLESELFGYVKGAFTGAVADRRGLFEEASGGTLFLDEVGDVSAATQAKLLRVLQEGEIRPVGSAGLRKVDVRILAATNRDLRAAIRAGSFREDLFFRLNVLTIEIPPLRERLEDVPSLVQHFLAKYAERYKKPGIRVSPATLEALARSTWPGNVRELEHAIQHALIVAQGKILTPESLPPQLVAGSSTDVVPAAEVSSRTAFSDARAAALADFEQRFVEEALAASKGNLALAARKSGMDKSNLRRLAQRHGIDPDRFKGG